MDNITPDLLNKWKQTPSINPLTKRKIKDKGPTYMKLQRLYDKIINKNDNSPKNRKRQLDKSKANLKLIKKTKLDDTEITNNYIEYRQNKTDPILLIDLPLHNKSEKDIFKFKYTWNPYNGKRNNQLDKNGPICFDPNSLIHYFYINRLNNLWNKEYIDEQNNLIQGYYGDAVSNGPDFKILSRGIHLDWYLFRLPITDEYLHNGHCHQSVTMGPKILDTEIKELYKLSKRYGTLFRKTYGYRRPNIIKMKRLYEQAISKNEYLDTVIGDSIPKEELKQIKYNLNVEAVNQLKIFR